MFKATEGAPASIAPRLAASMMPGPPPVHMVRRSDLGRLLQPSETMRANFLAAS